MKRISSLLALVALANSGFADPLPRPTIAKATPWRAPVPSLSTTPDGLSVAVVSRRALPLVHVTVVVGAGSGLDPANSPGLAAAVATMLQDGGAGSRDAPSLASAIEELGSELQVLCDRDGVRLSMTVLSDRLDRALALLGDLVARPRFDENEWIRVRARRVAEIVRASDEPRAIADQVFDRVVLGDHPYAHAVIGAQKPVELISVGDLKNFYAAHYGPRTTRVILVGDVDEKGAAERVAPAFANWKSSAAPSVNLKPAIAGKKLRLVLVDRPGAPQSEVRVGRLGVSRLSPDFPALSLLQMVLGGSFTSRLVQNLREKHGYTYGVRARFLLWRAPGPFVVSTAVRTDVTGPSLTEILAELKGIRTALPAAEADKGRALVASAIVDTFGDGARAAQLLGELSLGGMPFEVIARLPEDLAKLAIPSLTTAASRLFAEPLAIVVVGDRKVVEPQLRALPIGKSLEIRDAEGNPVK
jgi:zinc protease